MAIVKNAASEAGPADKSYFTHSRSGAGSPNASVTPAFAGEVYWDTTNKVRWKAVGLTSADWTPLTAEVT